MIINRRSLSQYNYYTKDEVDAAHSLKTCVAETPFNVAENRYYICPYCGTRYGKGEKTEAGLCVSAPNANNYGLTSTHRVYTVLNNKVYSVCLCSDCMQLFLVEG